MPEYCSRVEDSTSSLIPAQRATSDRRGEPAAAAADDSTLIDALRADRDGAMALLYARHYPTALRVARRLAGATGNGEDLVQDAFISVFAAITGGGGPTNRFSAYLLTTLRHLYLRGASADQRVRLRTDDEVLDFEAPSDNEAVEIVEAAAAAEQIMTAFRTLPPRWQDVLWRTEVDDTAATTVADELGISTNGVAALAYRARRGPALAYLDGQVDSSLPTGCLQDAPLVPQWLRSELSPSKAEHLEAHLRSCRRCTQMTEDMIDANSALLHGWQRPA